MPTVLIDKEKVLAVMREKLDAVHFFPAGDQAAAFAVVAIAEALGFSKEEVFKGTRYEEK